VALVLFVAGWLAYRRRWRELSCFAVIAIGGALLSEWVKEFVSRPRPSALSFIDYGNSFPSGHVTSAATIFGAAYYFLGKPCVGQWWRRYLATAGVVGLVLVIAFQRVYFTHHWLSDVVGGALLGTAGCFLPSIVFLAA
jgi:membrane-associated phospholipid phosphatase